MYVFQCEVTRDPPNKFVESSSMKVFYAFVALYGEWKTATNFAEIIHSLLNVDINLCRFPRFLIIIIYFFSVSKRAVSSECCILIGSGSGQNFPISDHEVRYVFIQEIV